MTQTRYWERLISRGALESKACAARASERNARFGGCHSLLFHAKGFSVFRLPMAVCWKIAQTHKHTHTQNSWEWVQCRGWPAGGSPLRTENGDESLPKGKKERMGVPTPLFLQLGPIYPIYYYSHLQCTSRKYATVNSLQSWFVAARGKNNSNNKLKN